MKTKIFTTGGSIDKFYSMKDSAFLVGPPMAGEILEGASVSMDYSVEEISRVDSLEIDDDGRGEIARRVRSDPATRILVTHGTDTTVQTARAIGHVPGKTVVLTGALQPATFKVTDAHFNIGFAFAAVQLLQEGTYVAMNGRVLDPLTTTKNPITGRFETP